MPKTVSPKQVARAIGVSESSLKRWCDQGLIEVQRTAGGHRRIPVSAVVQFLRSGDYSLAHPEILGLPATAGRSDWTLERARPRLREALIGGEEEACRQILLDLYLAGHCLSTICDQGIAETFHEIGALWECGDVEVYEERRACEMCLRAVHELRHLLPPPPVDAPVAFGATLDGDPYTLAVTIAELVLRDSGWNAQSLGHMLPFATLHTAIERHAPRLLWLSLSTIRDEDSFCTEMNRLFDKAEQARTALVIGGRSLSPEIRRRIRYSSYCDTFLNLQDFAETLISATSARRDHPASGDMSNSSSNVTGLHQ